MKIVQILLHNGARSLLRHPFSIKDKLKTKRGTISMTEAIFKI